MGDKVTITLPSNKTTPGVVSYVGTVATKPSGGGAANTNPTITVDVTPTHPRATGSLDQAPVQVAITSASVQNALIVPVNALLALGSGGYAVEVREPGGGHRLRPVTVGLFDDADGTVQVSGPGLGRPVRRGAVVVSTRMALGEHASLTQGGGPPGARADGGDQDLPWAATGGRAGRGEPGHQPG